MATNKIHLSNSFGKQVPFNAEKIKSALKSCEPNGWNSGHVWAEDPLMVCISRGRHVKKGPLYILIYELESIIVPKPKIRDQHEDVMEIFSIELKEDNIDEAIRMFMSLCKNPKKIFRRKLIKRMGEHAIFLHDSATKNPNI